MEPYKGFSASNLWRMRNFYLTYKDIENLAPLVREISWTRKICICVLTYIVVIAYSYIVRNYSNILLSSLVPVIGFTLSTLSLKYIRKKCRLKY